MACLEGEGPVVNRLARQIIYESVVKQQVHVGQEGVDVVQVGARVHPALDGGEVDRVADLQGVVRVQVGVHRLQEWIGKLRAGGITSLRERQKFLIVPGGSGGDTSMKDHDQGYWRRLWVSAVLCRLDSLLLKAFPGHHRKFELARCFLPTSLS